jgi:hypothetical protein
VGDFLAVDLEQGNFAHLAIRANRARAVLAVIR